MSTAFVGLENFPNVYFRDISISSINGTERSEKISRVHVKLVVKDTKINGNFQWANDDFLNTYLNVKILQSLNKDFTDQLTNGTYTLNALDYQKSLNYDMDSTTVLLKKLRSVDNPDLYLVDDNMYEFEYDFFFDLPESKLIDVAYFASINLDIDTMSVDFSADFNQDQIKFFQGPISSEKIFVDGILQTKTNVFYLPDDQIWSGPVHLHEGGYMTGAFHRSAQHANLRLIETENLKLKDKRNQINESKKLNTFTGNRLFIGTPYCTKDENNNIKKLIYFDMENMFLEKTKYGDLIKNLSPILFQQALSDFKLKKILLKRKFVKLNKSTNSFKNKDRGYQILSDRTETVTIASDETQFGFAAVGPVEDSGLRSILPDGTEKIQTKLVNEFRELTMPNKRYRYFTFVDKSFKDLKYGNYIYGIEISILDKTKTFLSSLYSTYKSDIKALERYAIRSTKGSNLDRRTQSFKSAFSESENQLYGLANVENLDLAPWSSGVQNYVNLKSYLYNLSDDDRQSQAQKIFASINPKTGTPQNISTFVEQYRNLVDEFIRKFDLEQIRSGTFNNKISPSNKNQTHPNLLTVKYNYDEIFSATDRREGYKIFDSADDSSFVVMDRDKFDDRRRREIRRFFKGKPNYSQDESKNLTSEDIEDLSDLESFSSAYMSPLRFVYESKNIDLSETNLVDNELLNNTINDMVTKKRRGRRIFKKRIGLKKPRTKVDVNDDNPKFENVSEYLGDTSPLLAIDFGYTLEDLSDLEKIKVEKKIKDAVNKKRKKKFIKKFDLTKKNNVIFRKKRDKKISKKLKRRRLKKIPLQIKALISSRSQNVRTNVLNSPDDLLASDETDNKLLIEHFAVQKIEYLSGFDTDKNGNPIFNKPMWKLLDLESYRQNENSHLICRSIYYNDETIDLSIPSDLNLEVFDKFFVINPASMENEVSSTFVSSLSLNYDANQAINYDYTTSNPVSQPLQENGIFTSAPLPDGDPATIATSSRNETLASRQRRGTQRSPSTTAAPTSTGGYSGGGGGY